MTATMWLVFHPHMQTAFRFKSEAEAKAALSSMQITGWRCVDIGDLAVAARMMVDEYAGNPNDHEHLTACANHLRRAVAPVWEAL